MATPSYKGAGQPQTDSGGFWSGLGSWLGGTTPAYKGDGQPSSASSGFLGTITPAYKPAPSANTTVSDTIARAVDASGVPGPVVVLVPRGVATPCEASEPQQDDE